MVYNRKTAYRRCGMPCDDALSKVSASISDRISPTAGWKGANTSSRVCGGVSLPIIEVSKVVGVSSAAFAPVVTSTNRPADVI